MKITYALTDCSRCGGSGHYSWCQRFGDTCFKCQGRGTMISKAGAEAKALVDAWAEEHMTVPASSLVPGQRVILNDRRATLAEVQTTLGYGGGKSKIGTEGSDTYAEWWTLGKTILRTKAGAGQQGAAHRPVRLAWTGETLQAAAQLLDGHPGATVTE